MCLWLAENETDVRQILNDRYEAKKSKDKFTESSQKEGEAKNIVN